MKKYIIYSLALLLASCSSDEVAEQQTNKTMAFTEAHILSDIQPYKNEVGTRVNFEGTHFENGDMIRLKLICPFVNEQQLGESTYSGSQDNFYLLAWNNNQWGHISSQLGYDLNADFSPSGGPGFETLSQGTPYVFTATTWTEEVHFVANGSIYDQFRNVFKADQTRLEDYKASDVLWAQQIMQTGTDHVHLSFDHKMSALRITVEGTTLSADAVLTLSNMPDIDQEEVIIGNYYAAQDHSNIRYGSKEKESCSYDNNGQVLGISVINESQSKVVQTAFTALPQTGVYTAYRPSTTSNEFYLIIPPYTVPAGVTPTLWLRDGDKRYAMPLPLPVANTFVSGYRYPITMNVTIDI